ncbi:MAG TPA: pilus assembly protein PilM [Patescibacteria group bacterium]|nr:pilus assembly protein PilM [Patescibacteria group bacterium]
MFDHFFSGIGVDISNRHVRFARVSLFQKIRGLKEIVLPSGLMEDEMVAHQEEIRKRIERGLEEWHLPKGSFRTTMLIPESRIFFTNVLLEKQAPAIMEDEAKHLAQKDIPIPFEQAFLTVSKGEISLEGRLFNVYACQREIINGLKAVVEVPSFRLIAMETNSKALLRLFNHFASKKERQKVKKSLIGVVDIGYDWTTVSIYSSFGSLFFSRTLSHSHLVQKDGDVPPLPPETIGLVLETMRETKDFFSKQGKEIALFLLGGVEATQKGVLKACQREEKTLPPTIPIGQKLQISGFAADDIHRFGPAIGAAYRSLFPQKYAHQHNFFDSSNS